MAAISYIGAILAVSTTELLLGEERMCAKTRIDISKTEGLVCVYIDRRILLDYVDDIKQYADQTTGLINLRNTH